MSALKSDQNGIEIEEAYRFIMTRLELKSDQNGIEICEPGFRIELEPQVKIRPKWD